MEPNFYICETCGNLIAKIEDKGVPVMCCGKKMKALQPGTKDAAAEKHIPVISRDKNHITVKVGSAEHPMTEEHLISWIVICTDSGYQIKYLSHNDKPQADFYVAEDERVNSALAYCNLHELWKAEY